MNLADDALGVLLGDEIEGEGKDGTDEETKEEHGVDSTDRCEGDDQSA